MDKERKHGTAMDFSEIVRCIKWPRVMFQHVYDVRVWKNKVGYWTSGSSSPLCFMQIRVGGSVKTQHCC
jgi:hypothetical protein